MCVLPGRPRVEIRLHLLINTPPSMGFFVPVMIFLGALALLLHLHREQVLAPILLHIIESVGPGQTGFPWWRPMAVAGAITLVSVAFLFVRKKKA